MGRGLDWERMHVRGARKTEVMERQPQVDDRPGDGYSRIQRRAERTWRDALRWWVENSFSPRWLPQRWQRPVVGYVAALLLTIGAVLATQLLQLALGDFRLTGLVMVLGVLIVAQNWGAGPSLFSTIIGAILLNYYLLRPELALSHHELEDVVATILYIIVGASVSVLASQTERARQTAELRAARAHEMLGVTSHELRTPLNAARGNVQLAERQLKRAQGQNGDSAQTMANVYELLERTKRQLDRQDRLVRDLVDISRVQTGRFELQMQPTDLAALVLDVVEEQRQANPQRLIRLEMAENEAVQLVADPDRVQQALTNYLTNALKYSPPDRAVDVGLLVKDGTARVAVRDRGRGLSRADQERIWDPFQRVANAPAGKVVTDVNLGLGLYITKIIVEQHGGTVGVRSSPSKGSTFWFTLPMSEPAAVGSTPGEK